MLRTLSIAGVLGALCLTAATGCAVQGQVRTRAYGSTPDLVMVEPGVYVVADFDEPVFYTDGYYWLNRGSTWYRSPVYTGGWVRVSRLPVGVRRIHTPHRYVHYRPRGNVHVYRAPQHRGEAPRRIEARDRNREHRTEVRRGNQYRR